MPFESPPVTESVAGAVAALAAVRAVADVEVAVHEVVLRPGCSWTPKRPRGSRLSEPASSRGDHGALAGDPHARGAPARQICWRADRATAPRSLIAPRPRAAVWPGHLCLGLEAGGCSRPPGRRARRRGARAASHLGRRRVHADRVEPARRVAHLRMAARLTCSGVGRRDRAVGLAEGEPRSRGAVGSGTARGAVSGAPAVRAGLVAEEHPDRLRLRTRPPAAARPAGARWPARAPSPRRSARRHRRHRHQGQPQPHRCTSARQATRIARAAAAPQGDGRLAARSGP